MKLLLTATIMLSLTTLAHSQAHYDNDTLYTQSGYKVYKGMDLDIGVGSTPDGDFKFIRRNSSGFGTAMMMSNNNAYNKSELSLGRTLAGHKGRVVKIVERGSKKIGYTYEPLITFGSGRYEIDIDNAIAVGELKVPDEFKPKPKETVVVVQQQVSVADELTKLKKLFDDGVLTKEEYDAQKAKVLSRN